MTSAESSALVSELIAVKRQIASLETLKSALEEKLLHEAERLLKADGHKPNFVGCRYEFRAPDGALGRVSFPNDALIREFRFNDASEAFRTRGSGAKTETIMLPGLRRHAGDHFDALFTTHHKPAKAFRELAGALLGESARAKLIDLVTEPSSPRVSTEAAQSTPGD